MNDPNKYTEESYYRLQHLTAVYGGLADTLIELMMADKLAEEDTMNLLNSLAEKE